MPIHGEGGASHIVNDPSLSFTALGVWNYLFCQSWDEFPSVEAIIDLGRGDPDEIRTAIADLQTRGFIVVTS